MLVTAAVSKPAAMPTASIMVMALAAMVSSAGMPTFLGVAVDVFAVASRTGIGTTCATRHGKPMVAFRTDKMTIAFHCYASPFDSHRQALDQRLRNLAPRALDEPSKGRPRNIDLCRSFPVVQPLQIPQPEGFQLIPAQDDFARVPERDSGRFKHPHRRVCANPSAFMRSSHC
jgi:hypothetical protein